MVVQALRPEAPVERLERARNTRPFLAGYARELQSRMGRDLTARVSGVAVIAGAGGLVSLGAGIALPEPFSFALGLTSFCLACLGTLFLIHGATLRDRWWVRLTRTEAVTPAFCPPDCRCLKSWAFEGRPSMATYLVLSAQGRAGQCSARRPRRRAGTRRS